MEIARYGILLGLWAGLVPVCHAENLNWGTLFKKGAAVSPQTEKYLAGVLSEARAKSDQCFPAVATIIGQGHLNTDPGWNTSYLAKKNIPMFLKLAVCARNEKDPVQRESCLQTAKFGLMTWAEVYKPNGDPINEAIFIPWAQALDVLNPLLEPNEKAQLEKFARAIIAAGDKYYGGMSSRDGKYYNNWGTYRLCERAFLAAAIGDKDMLKATGKMLDAHLQENLLDNGQSIDFRDRDAFHYHVYDLYPLIEVAAQMPKGFLSGASMARIQKSLDFMRPYFMGEKENIEFKDTKVAFDIKRKKAGYEKYQNQPWDPTEARELLRLGRVPFPGIRNWTGSTVDAKYSNMFKLMVSVLEN